LHTAWITEEEHGQYGMVLFTNWYLWTIVSTGLPWRRMTIVPYAGKETIKHRIIVCWEGRSIWKWTCTRLASILRTNEAQIPDEWPMCPAFHLWPPKRQQAVLWILAQFIFFRTQYHTTTNLLEYYDFMRRKRKAYQQSKRQDLILLAALWSLGLTQPLTEMSTRNNSWG
jgi:hypothetical protein